VSASAPAVADDVERRGAAELVQPGDGLRVVGQVLRRVDAGSCASGRFGVSNVLPSTATDGADEVGVGAAAARACR
jgi:hypothetical protein